MSDRGHYKIYTISLCVHVEFKVYLHLYLLPSNFRVISVLFCFHNVFLCPHLSLTNNHDIFYISLFTVVWNLSIKYCVTGV